MKSVNGILLIVLSLFVLWIGVTGRFPKLMEAIGILRGDTGGVKPDAYLQPNPPAGSVTLPSGAIFGPDPKGYKPPADPGPVY